ncbi:hypothetical protein M413DRAFT_259287 [Hebeloma cylindrosporum]|uniref:Uncharacterized protein n=1 Tax=Hebeloma cylindrosporum TaxID=76867 RepID=A0A0C3C080_HEBCY|nr:hypothetical protein M413DRAFT_259287 [Hebeloma cylindrosporum h7]
MMSTWLLYPCPRPWSPVEYSAIALWNLTPEFEFREMLSPTRRHHISSSRHRYHPTRVFANTPWPLTQCSPLPLPFGEGTLPH